MSLVSEGLTGVIIALSRTSLNNGEVIMRIYHLLLHNKRHRAMAMPARTKANGNFSDLSVERFYSFRINYIMSPSDADDLRRSCNSLSEFQVVHRYVLTVV